MNVWVKVSIGSNLKFTAPATPPNTILPFAVDNLVRLANPVAFSHVRYSNDQFCTRWTLLPESDPRVKYGHETLSNLLA